jgi:hypothetical protein
VLEERIGIRWRDMDAYGHVNNAVYLTYLEEARDAWVQRTLGTTDTGTSFWPGRDRLPFRLTQATRRSSSDIVCGRSAGRASVRARDRRLDGTLSASAESVIAPGMRRPDAPVP